jgi:hypothetical protein
VKERPDVLYAFQPTQSALSALLLPFRQSAKLVFGVRAAGMEVARYDTFSALAYRLEAWLSRRADLRSSPPARVRADAISAACTPGALRLSPMVSIRNHAARSAAGRAQRHAWGLSMTPCHRLRRPLRSDEGLRHFPQPPQLARAHSDARFVCVGDGPPGYRDRVRGWPNRSGSIAI